MPLHVRPPDEAPALLAVVSIALLVLPPADARAPACTDLRDAQRGGTVCDHDHDMHLWVCHSPVDLGCLVRHPCGWPAIP